MSRHEVDANPFRDLPRLCTMISERAHLNRLLGRTGQHHQGKTSVRVRLPDRRGQVFWMIRDVMHCRQQAEGFCHDGLQGGYCLGGTNRGRCFG